MGRPTKRAARRLATSKRPITGNMNWQDARLATFYRGASPHRSQAPSLRSTEPLSETSSLVNSWLKWWPLTDGSWNQIAAPLRQLDHFREGGQRHSFNHSPKSFASSLSSV